MALGDGEIHDGFRDSIEKLLSDLDEELLSALGESVLPELASERGRNALGRAELVPDYDGRVEVRLSEDEMLCYATFHPPRGEGRPISPDDLLPLFEEKGVAEGVHWDRINDCIFRANTDREQLSDVVIAEGREAVSSIPRHVIPETSHFGPHPGEGREQQQVDYREFSSFVLVDEGDVIGHVVPKHRGRPGVTVTGREIAPTREVVESFELGENTRIQDREVLATARGRLLVENGRLEVALVLEVDSDVGYETGNIAFPGDVIIGGEVRDRFAIECEGSLFCKTTLDASTVKVGGDITVFGGIIGRREGYVGAGGTVTAKFIENCYVEAGKDVRVKTGIVNSVVCTQGSLIMGERGTIIGGTITAAHGVEAAQVGSPHGRTSEIICGIDYTVRDQLAWIRDSTMKLGQKLQQLEMQTGGAVDDAAADLKTRIRNKIHELNQRAGNLIGALDTDEDAAVVVRRIIYPGNVIEIARASISVTRTLQRVVITLNKQEGKLQITPLHQRGAAKARRYSSN